MQPFSCVAIRMAVGLNLFEHICAAKGPISSAQLSKLTDGEEILICKYSPRPCTNVRTHPSPARILRVVASIDFIQQTGPYTWLANHTTHAMSLPSIAARYRYISPFPFYISPPNPPTQSQTTQLIPKQLRSPNPHRLPRHRLPHPNFLGQPHIPPRRHLPIRSANQTALIRLLANPTRAFRRLQLIHGGRGGQ